ncbi:MAG: DUF1353 domain-containing protein [Candidatus Omnitrophica bacterium]|nr:DUF1353 domain-containing protein [Candidatus Omnitrophota bacterium]
MSSFTSELIVKPCVNGKDWILKRPFTYHVKSKFSRTYISVPKGFITDFASIPSIFFFLPKWAKFNKCPVLHDYLYQQGTIQDKDITRKQADDIFYEAMLVEFRDKRFGKLIANLEYYTVRLVAGFAWHK